MTLPELAAGCGLSKATLSQIERGRMVANARELGAISDWLGMPFENRTVPVSEVVA